MSNIVDRYRQRVAAAAAGIRVPGMGRRPDRPGASLPLEEPPAHIQGLWFAGAADADADEQASGRHWTLDPALIDLFSTIRRDGAEFSRRGQAYRALERPRPIRVDDALRRHQQVALIGVAGSGKTTLLAWLAQQAARAPESPLPVFLNLFDYEAFRHAGGQDTLPEFALRQAADGDADLYQALRDAPALLWLLDDLHAASAGRAALMRQICDLPGRVVAASACAQHRQAGLESFAPYEVLPMNDEELARCIGRWLGWRAKSAGMDARWVQERTEWIETELSRRPAMRHSVRNPFALMTILRLAGEMESPAEFPENRAALCDAWLDLVIASGAAARPPSWTPEAECRMLARLAELGLRVPIQPVAEALRSLRDALDGDSESEEAHAALLERWRAAGLVDVRTIRETPYVRVAHACVSEYVLARDLRRRWRENPRDAWNRVRPSLHHAAWQESVVLMAEGLTGDPVRDLLARIQRAGSAYEDMLHRDLRLAARLLYGCGEAVEDSVATQIIQQAARMGRPGRKMRRIVLLAGYGAGLLGILGLGAIAGLTLSWLPVLLAGVFWTLFWAAVLITHEFPLFQNLAFFPLRFWKLPQERRRLAGLLGLSGYAGAVPFLITTLQDDEAAIRRAAAEALGHIANIDAIPDILPMLHDANLVVRRTAALALGKIGAIPRLAQALNDGDTLVREAAEDALERLQKAQAIPHLALMLDTDNAYARKAAAQTLRRIGGETTVRPLLRALKDEDKEVRLIAAEALGDMAGPAVLHVQPEAKRGLLDALRDAERPVRWAAAYALGKIEDSTLGPELLDALKHSDDYVERAIADALRKVVRVPSILSLLQGVKNADARVRAAALEALRGICARGECSLRWQVAAEILPLLHDDSMLVRRTAVEILGMSAQDELVPALLECVRDEQWQVRRAAAEALGNIGDPHAVDALVPLLKDCYGYVGRAAADALGNIGGDAVVPELIRALQSEKSSIRDAAERALRSIDVGYTVPFLLHALRDERDYLRRDAEATLQQIGRAEAIPYLLEALDDDEAGVRRIAALALGRISDAAAIPALIECLQDTEEDVRSVAAEALGEIGAREAIAPLIQMLDDSGNKARRMAAKALGRLRAAEAAEPLLFMLADSNVNVRRVAVEALGRIASEVSVPALREALRDDAWWLRWSAAYALGRIGDRQVVPDLLEALRDPNGNVRRAAAESLGQLGAPDAVQPLVDALLDEEWWVRWAAVTALGHIHDPATLLSLIPLLQDSSEKVRRAAVEALGEFGSGKAAPYLIQCLRDHNWEVRQAAASALCGISEPGCIPDLLQAIKSGHAYMYKAAKAALENMTHPDAIPFLVKGIREDHDLLREAAAEHLIRLGGPQALRELLGAVVHEHWRVRRMAAIAIGQLADSVDDGDVLKRAARALWWRLTDTAEVADAAFQALDLVAARLASVEQHP